MEVAGTTNIFSFVWLKCLQFIIPVLRICIMQINLGEEATVVIHDEAESMGGTGDALPLPTIMENHPITITAESSEYEVERVITLVAGQGKPPRQ